MEAGFFSRPDDNGMEKALQVAQENEVSLCPAVSHPLFQASQFGEERT